MRNGRQSAPRGGTRFERKAWDKTSSRRLQKRLRPWAPRRDDIGDGACIGRQDYADDLLPPDEQGDEVRLSEGASYLLTGMGHWHLFSSLSRDAACGNRMHAL